MRILHAVHAYPPHVGGSEHVVARLSRGLAERGHMVEVATSEHATRGREVDGIPVIPFPRSARGARAYRSFVQDGVRERRWDVVMTYHSKVWTHLALAPFKVVGPRWVYCPTEFTDLHSRRPRHRIYYRAMEPRSLRRAKRVKVLTHADVERAVRLAGEEVRPRIRVIPNGVDFAWWNEGGEGDVRARYGLPKDAPLVVAAGGLWPHKEVETLVRALARVPDAHLIVAGPDRGRQTEVEAVVHQAGVAERVHLVGVLPRPDLRALYHAAAVHASASHKEGFGLTFLEAMSCGLPVVARSVGVVPELAERGAVVEIAEDERSLALALARALALDGSKNADIAKQYDWERVLDLLEACYEEVGRA